MLRPSSRFGHAGRLVLLSFVLTSQAWGIDLLDPLFTKLDTPPTVAGTMQDESAPELSCDRSISNKVSLYDAVALALCNNPQTINSWIGIQQQAAQQGLARSAYFPTINATLQENRTHTYGYVKGYNEFATDNRNEVASETINLSWVLFDFGARQAKSENAKQLLIAAIQNHQASLLSIFSNTAKDYYIAIATLSNIESAREIKKAAEANLAAADARVKSGVAPTSDLLQAKTQFAQSVFNLARAEGEHVSSMGVLASDMGFSPSTEFALTENRDEALGSTTFVKDVAVLLEQAKKQNPIIAQAQARLSAAQASQWASIADDLPTLSLSANASRSTRPTNYGPKLGELDSITQNRYIGLQIDIPLFTGFSSFYKARSAQAAVDTQEQLLRAAELQVGQDVWRSYQAFKTSTENLQNTETILESARLQLIAAQERYKLGVTNILELTNAQSVLADALQQRTRSLAEWRTARLQLASNIGILGVWAIR
jgi:outer membrane protein